MSEIKTLGKGLKKGDIYLESDGRYLEITKVGIDGNYESKVVDKPEEKPTVTLEELKGKATELGIKGFGTWGIARLTAAIEVAEEELKEKTDAEAAAKAAEEQK